MKEQAMATASTASSSGIDDVSDTALWVAVYRARETARPDALFNDRLASLLAGERGNKIASKMKGSRYTEWSVVTRTCIIDAYIQRLVETGVNGDGVDKIETVLNLGAGLDTRPYRLKLPVELNWIEADFPHMIERKNELLKNEKPVCRLERVAVDLGNEAVSAKFLSDVAARSGRTLVLTEGVVPYLTETQVASLAANLRAHPEFRLWIVDYFAKALEKFMSSKRVREQMKNAPFVFFPADWNGFFAKQGWRAREWRYLVPESEKLGRTTPYPLLMRILAPVMRLFMSAEKKDSFRKFTAYVLLEPK
jgi:methyltransferase (TIGR00027 family)